MTLRSLAFLPLLMTALLPLPTAAQPAAPDTRVLDVHVGQPRAGWQITVADFEGQRPFGAPATVVPRPEKTQLPGSSVGARLADRTGSGDALALQFKDTWYANLRLEGGPPLDLRAFVGDGVLEFDLKVNELARGDLGFKVTCGPHCERKIPFNAPGRALIGKGWQRVAFAMRCLVREGDDFGRITQPFAIEASGSGEVAVANVRYVRGGTPNASCPDFRTESVTAAAPDQAWTQTWWPQRHQQKLAENRALLAAGKPPKLVFAGDSITEGWGKEGATAWQQHFAPHGAVNLGYGGDRTENLLWRLQNGEVEGLAPAVFVLMIGTNNTGHRQEDPATTAAGVRRVIDEVRQRLPGTRILLLAIPPRGAKADDPLRRINDAVNARIASFADGKHIVFLDPNRVLLQADGTLSTEVMPDLLHLSPHGYALWANAILPALTPLLARP